MVFANVNIFNLVLCASNDESGAPNHKTQIISIISFLGFDNNLNLCMESRAARNPTFME